jgi:cell division protein FtsA
MSSQFIAGLDIGTSSVKGVVAEWREGRLTPRLFVREISGGVRKGAIVDMVEAGPAIVRVVSEMRKFSKAAARNIYVGVGTSEIKVQSSRGIVAVSRADNEIYAEDVDRAVKASQAVNVAANRTVLHNIVREFIVDGVSEISDPIGLSGARLEASSLVIDAFAAHVKSIVKAVELSGGGVGGLVLTPLAAARAVLTKSQKDLGVAVLDIGGGTTGLTVYDENKLVGVAKFPAGALNISKDIAIGLKIPVSVGEQIKLSSGFAVSRSVGAKEQVDLRSLYPESRAVAVPRRFVSEIIESRLAEILEFASNEIKAMGRAGTLAGGVVLVGGGCKLPGMSELVTQELKLTCQMGVPIMNDWGLENAAFSTDFEDPEYVAALGLVLYALEESDFHRGGLMKNFSLTSWLKNFLP